MKTITPLSWLNRFWSRFEEIMVAFLLAAMTFITFIYVVFNNLYNVFFELAERFPSTASFADPIGEFIMEQAQNMTWSVAMTKACFGWLIFFGASYGVRTAGHIGVDALVKRFNHLWQRRIALFACFLCIVYSIFIGIASYEWIKVIYVADIGADDLHQFHLKLWHIGFIMPFGFSLIALRFLEMFCHIYQGKQLGLGLADESEDALKLSEHEGASS